MNANPRYIEHGMGDFNPPDDSEREAAIEARTEALIAEMWQDPEYLSDAAQDAIATIGWYRSKSSIPNHPQALHWLDLAAEGWDDHEAMRMLREAMRDAISDAASDRAEKEFGV